MKGVKNRSKGTSNPVHHDVPHSQPQTTTKETELKKSVNLKEKEIGVQNHDTRASPGISNPTVHVKPSSLTTLPTPPLSRSTSRPPSRLHGRTPSEEIRMADATLAHISLLLPDDAQPSSETNESSIKEIASSAALMAYMQQRPNDFLPEDTKKIFTSLLHHSLFAFDDQSNHADFPLIVRMTSSLSAMDQAFAERDSDGLLGKMALAMVKYVREKDNTTTAEARLLEELGRVKVELENCRDRLSDLELWKKDRQLAEGNAKVKLEKTEKGAKATISLLTLEKAKIQVELDAKTKALDIARKLVNDMRQNRPNEAVIQMMQESHEMEMATLLDEHHEEISRVENQLFDAERRCRDLEQEVSLLASMKDSDELLVDNSGGDASLWKEEYESASAALGKQKSPDDVRIEGQQLVINDLQSLVNRNQTRIEELEKKVAELSLALVKVHKESANHAVESSKLKNEVASLTEIVKLREKEVALTKANLTANRDRTQKLQATVTELTTARVESSKVIEQLTFAVDSTRLRAFQDQIILNMAIIAQIIPKFAEKSLSLQRQSLSNFLRQGQSGFPNRYIDIICMCVVNLEYKRKKKMLDDRDRGFAVLLSSDEAICETYDFALSDASWTRDSGNTSAHPGVGKFSELDAIIGRSVHTEERPIAKRCAAAHRWFAPDEDKNQRMVLAEVLRGKTKIANLKEDHAMKERHDTIKECLEYYRDGGGWAWKKTPKF